jgi:hypothetical protein
VDSHHRNEQQVIDRCWKIRLFCEIIRAFEYSGFDVEVGVMARDTALVFESLAEALRAKELIDAAGKPKYWLTFIDRVEHQDDGAAVRQGAGQVASQSH